jgi:two-component system phosphate regulon sensor histidine kinase PhoR
MRRDRILVVDDSPLMRKMTARILQKHGFEVLTAENGEEGCRQVLETSPDLVMMDLLMPVLDGMSAVRSLKSHDQTRHIPIIVFTTECSLEEKVRALEAGASDFLSKESDEAEIIARVRSLLRVKALEDVLLQEKKKLSSILNDLAEAVVIIDTENKIILSNNAAATLLDIPTELVGVMEISRLVSAADRADEFLDALKKNELEDFALDIQDGEKRRSFQVSSSDVYLSFSEPLGRALVFRDVTQEKEMEVLKASFYSMIAHDLRSPISVVTGYTSLILAGKAGQISDIQKEFLESIQSRSEAMLKLVDEFLTVSKFEASFVSLEFEDTDLASLLTEVVNSLSLIAANKQIKVVFDPGDEPRLIRGDREKLFKVFSNLFDNALKYTPDGGSVEMTLEKGETEYRIEFRDTGIGIDQEELEFVFDRFKRMSTAEKKKIKGTGLGLTIVKEIVNAHKGRVWVESQVGAGSTFIVTLPASPPADAVEKEKAKEDLEPADINS